MSTLYLCSSVCFWFRLNLVTDAHELAVIVPPPPHPILPCHWTQSEGTPLFGLSCVFSANGFLMLHSVCILGLLDHWKIYVIYIRVSRLFRQASPHTSITVVLFGIGFSNLGGICNTFSLKTYGSIIQPTRQLTNKPTNQSTNPELQFKDTWDMNSFVQSS